MNRKQIFSTVAIMAMSLVGCDRSNNSNEAYVQQLNDSIATLNIELAEARAALADCEASKAPQKVTKKKAKKSAKKPAAKKAEPAVATADAKSAATVSQTQGMTVGDCSNHVENVTSTIEMGNDNNNNTVVINNGIINNYNGAQNATATSSSDANAAAGAAQPTVKMDCKVSGDIKVTVTRNINIKSR